MSIITDSLVPETEPPFATVTYLAKHEVGIEELKGVKKHIHNMRQLIHNSKRRMECGNGTDRKHFIKEHQDLVTFLGKL